VITVIDIDQFEEGSRNNSART